jgi:hypothetical protein
MAVKPKRRGRPRKPGPRTDSGQLSRASGPPPDETARQARMRIFGVSEKDASTPEAATFIGRLTLLGDLSKEQYQAIERFLSIREQYRRGVGVPDSLANFTGGPSPAYDEDEAIKRFQKVKDRHMGAMRTIDDLAISLPRDRISAAREAVITDQDAPDLIGAIRLLGNSLERFYRG